VSPGGSVRSFDPSACQDASTTHLTKRAHR